MGKLTCVWGPRELGSCPEVTYFERIGGHCKLGLVSAKPELTEGRESHMHSDICHPDCLPIQIAEGGAPHKERYSVKAVDSQPCKTLSPSRRLLGDSGQI